MDVVVAGRKARHVGHTSAVYDTESWAMRGEHAHDLHSTTAGVRTKEDISSSSSPRLRSV